MYRLVPALVSEMGSQYPELGRAQSLISETLKLEETRSRKHLVVPAPSERGNRGRMPANPGRRDSFQAL